jgi:hypothetical protein
VLGFDAFGPDELGRTVSLSAPSRELDALKDAYNINIAVYKDTPTIAKCKIRASSSIS